MYTPQLYVAASQELLSGMFFLPHTAWLSWALMKVSMVSSVLKTTTLWMLLCSALSSRWSRPSRSTAAADLRKSSLAVLFSGLLCLFSFWFCYKRVLLCCSCWPGTCFADQVGFKITEICLPLAPQYWDYRCVPSLVRFIYLFNQFDTSFNFLWKKKNINRKHQIVL